VAVSGRAAGVNVEQTRAWDGPEGDNWTDREDWYNAATRFLSPHLFAGAAIETEDRVLDLGSGCGETTRDAARRAQSGQVLGIDLSRRMIERARERSLAEGLVNVRFVHGDAQVYPFEAPGFDVVISRYGSMFFDDPVQAFINVGKALRPGARLALLCWREIPRNEWLMEIRAALAAGRELPEPPPDAPSPVSFADRERVEAILHEAGFEQVRFDSIEEPVYFGPDAARAFEDVTKLGIVAGLLSDVADRARGEALERVRVTLRDHETPEGVLFESSSWLVRAAKLPSRRRAR
jgi:SAM-dependent methyltransferase